MYDVAVSCGLAEVPGVGLGLFLCTFVYYYVRFFVTTNADVWRQICSKQGYVSSNVVGIQSLNANNVAVWTGWSRKEFRESLTGWDGSGVESGRDGVARSGSGVESGRDGVARTSLLESGRDGVARSSLEKDEIQAPRKECRLLCLQNYLRRVVRDRYAKSKSSSSSSLCKSQIPYRKRDERVTPRRRGA